MGRMLRLSDLIEISSHIDGVKRIRYTTSHPLDMTDDLIDVYIGQFLNWLANFTFQFSLDQTKYFRE